VATITAPIWKPSAEYRVKAMFTSRFRASLDSLTKNRPGESSRIFTLVVLCPDNNNHADPNAVAVMTQQAPPRQLGYLPSAIAAQYRQRMDDAGFSHLISACEATVSGGLVTTEKNYEYVVELDLDLSIDPHPDHLVMHPELVRHPADPKFARDASGIYRFTCWLPRDALENHHPKLKTKGWTTSSWSTVNYYLCNDKSIGLGFKLLSVPKSEHLKVFGAEPVVAVVEKVERRWVTLRLESEE